MRNKRGLIVRISVLFCILVSGCTSFGLCDESSEYSFEEVIKKYNLELPEKDQKVIHGLGFKILSGYYMGNEQNGRYYIVLYAYDEAVDSMKKTDANIFIIPTFATAKYRLPKNRKNGKGVLVSLEYYDWIENEFHTKKYTWNARY